MHFRTPRTTNNARPLNQHQRAELQRLRREAEDARQRVWHYAEELRQQGFSMLEVAALLDVSGPTVYRHLPRQGTML